MRFYSVILILSIFILSLPIEINGQEMTRFDILPQDISIEVGHSVVFTALAYTANETVYTPVNLQWETTGGSITPQGLYSAGDIPGDYTVTVICGNLRASTDIHVKTFIPPIARVEVTPPNIILEVGRNCQFTATAYDESNQAIPFTPVWTVNGGGTIDSTGVFQAANYGHYIVTATDPQSTNLGNANIFIRPSTPLISRLEIFPPDAKVFPMQTVKFDARAYDENGREVNCTPMWSATGGFIEQDGTYRAGQRPGSFQIMVMVRDTNNNPIQATASVTIPGAPFPPGPYPHKNGRIDIRKWDVEGGNFITPKVKIDIHVYGRSAQTVKLFAVSMDGNIKELQAVSCREGTKVEFRCKYFALTTAYLEIVLYDNMGEVLAREKREVSKY